MAILESRFSGRVNVREIWPDEAQQFTPWLAENLALLGEALQLDLELDTREARVGNNMSLDILATDGNGARVAIENQLGKTDHGHFGQLLTYAAWYDASTLIWVTDDFRHEHSRALRWLNRWTRKKIEIYGVEVRVLAIGNSIRVPKFVPVVSPIAQSKNLVPEGWMNSVSDREELFQLLVNKMGSKGFTNTRRTDGWIQQFASKSVPGLTYNAGFKNAPRVFIDMENKKMRERVFATLRKNRKQMEKELGIEGDLKAEIEWGKWGKRRKNKNISVIREKPENHWKYSIYSVGEFEEIWDWIFDYLVRFDQVFDARVGEIMEERGWSR
ncbi:MAG: DUF4268 domain-containing protein [Chloroflexi bacterium]|nr:DUF4268 domain-containing protein [Chloroflexota bacterium]